MRTATFFLCAVVLVAGCGGGAVNPADGGKVEHVPGSGGGDGSSDAVETDEAADSSLAPIDALDAKDGGDDGGPNGDVMADSAGQDSNSDSNSVDDSGSADREADLPGEMGGDVPADGGGVGAAAFVGDWSFVGGTNDIRCSDNTSQAKDLTNETLQVTSNPGGGLVAPFYCPWILDAVPGSMMTAIRPNQSCMSTGGGTAFTWMGQTFVITLVDASNATLASRINANFVDPISGLGTCTLNIVGQLRR